MGMHHHRTAWSYRPELLADAVALRHRLAAAAVGEGTVDIDGAAEMEAAFFDRLDDDLDTPGAIRVLERLAGSGVPARTDGIPVAGLVTRLASILGAQLTVAAPHPIPG
jgi:cysteinyl-tRNA synthetase